MSLLTFLLDDLVTRKLFELVGELERVGGSVASSLVQAETHRRTFFPLGLFQVPQLVCSSLCLRRGSVCCA